MSELNFTILPTINGVMHRIIHLICELFMCMSNVLDDNFGMTMY